MEIWRYGVCHQSVLYVLGVDLSREDTPSAVRVRSGYSSERKENTGKAECRASASALAWLEDEEGRSGIRSDRHRWNDRPISKDLLFLHYAACTGNS
jgi:hypothetical protein